MLLQLVLTLLGVAILSFSGKIVARSVADIAKHLGIPQFVIALFLVAFATSIPELFVGINSALQGNPSLSLGDVFGSNIVNLTLIAGLTIVLGRKGVSLGKNMSRSQLLWTFGAGSLPLLLLFDGSLSRIDGCILLAAFAAYFMFLTRKKEEVIEAADIEKETVLARLMESKTDRRRKMLHSFVLFALGMILLIGGARLVVTMAVGIAGQVGIPVFFIGLFIVAIGTSLPELTYGVKSAFSQEAELGLGNVIGSSAVNSSLILGIVSLIHPIVPAVFGAALASGIFMLTVFVIFFFLARSRGTLHIREGLILVALYLIFIAYQAKSGGFF